MYTLLMVTISYLIIIFFKYNVLSIPIDYEATTEKISIIKCATNNDGNGNYNFRLVYNYCLTFINKKIFKIC